MKLSNRVLKMEESVTLAAAARAKDLKAEGRDILSLTLGEPDFPTPKNIQQAAVAAIEDGKASFYTVASGLPELKEAIVQYFANYYGYEIKPNQVTVATGAKFSLYTFFMSVLDPGDEAIIPTPYWVSYGDQIQMAEGVPVFVQATEENDFKVTVDQLEAVRTDKTKVLVLNSPSNPTGMIYTAEELLAIGNWAVEHDILILADDIYGRLVYNGNEFTPISSLSEAIRKQTVVINGVSKSYSMTGWRIGYAVGEPEIIAAMSKVAGQTTSNPTTVAQYAAIEALTAGKDDAQLMKAEYIQRRDYIIEQMTELGYQIIKPDGAFYIFAKIPAGYNQDSFAFLQDFAEKKAVAFIPGAAFGQYGEGYIRLSYAASMETIKEALKRLKEYMEGHA